MEGLILFIMAVVIAVVLYVIITSAIEQRENHQIVDDKRIAYENAIALREML